MARSPGPLKCRVALILAIFAFPLSADGARAQGKPNFEIVPQLARPSWVSSVAFSPEGARVLSGSGDGTVKLWDAATGTLLRRFERSEGPVMQPVLSVAFSAHGDHVASGGKDSTVKLWDAATGMLVRTLVGHTSAVTSVAFSPKDGSRVLSGSDDGTVKLWDATTGTLLHTFGEEKGPTMTPVWSVAFSSDGDRVLSGNNDNTVKLWDVATGTLLHTFVGHTGAVWSVAFSPNGDRVLSGSDDNTVKLWDATTFTLLQTFVGHTGAVASVGFSPHDGSHVLSGSGDKRAKLQFGMGSVRSDNTTKLWDAATGTLLNTFVGHTGAIWSVAFSPNGDRVLSGGEENAVELRDATTGELLHAFEIRSGLVTSVAYSPDGGHILSGNDDNTVKLWDAATGTLLHTFVGHTRAVTSVAFSPKDGSRVLSGSDDGTVKLWDAATGALVRTFEGLSGPWLGRQHPVMVAGPVHSVAFSPDGGRVLFGTSDNAVELWDVATGAHLHTFEHAGPVHSVAFSPDGAWILSGSWDNTVKVWDASTGALLRTFNAGRLVTSVAFSPKDRSRVLSSSDDNTVKLWDADTGQLLHIFEGDWNWVTSVAFSPDGARVLSGNGDGTVKLWDGGTGALLYTFKGHSGPVHSVAFSPDGYRILSGSSDGTVRIWSLPCVSRASRPPTCELAALIGIGGGEWLAITPAGFFDASDDGLKLLSVVRGFEVFSVEQFRDQLQRKDLLRDLLALDVWKRYEEEASKLNLEEIIQKSGAPPTVQFIDSFERAGNAVRLKVNLFNNAGGGIGEQLIFRVKDQSQGGTDPGQTQGETEPAELKGLKTSRGPVVVTHVLNLDPSKKYIVSVTAFNGAGNLASKPVEYRIDKFGETPAEQPRPRMFILAIGVDSYTGPNLKPLNYAVNDVKELSKALKAAAEAGGYDPPTEIIERTEKDATKDKIEAAFKDIADRVQPKDAFILHLAGHGRSVQAQYYYVPYGAHLEGEHTIDTEGIPLKDWFRWIASVQVEKKLVIVDTCESLNAIYMVRGGGEELAHEISVEHLQRLGGESVITAARGEDLENSSLAHGVLTFAVLKVLSLPAPAGTLIDVEGIGDFVKKEVPILSKAMGREQIADSKISISFPVGEQGVSAKPQEPIFVFQSGRYILDRTCAPSESKCLVNVRSSTDPTADVIHQLEVPTDIKVIEFLPDRGGGWAKISLGANAIGYVPQENVRPLH